MSVLGNRARRLLFVAGVLLAALMVAVALPQAQIDDVVVHDGGAALKATLPFAGLHDNDTKIAVFDFTMRPVAFTDIYRLVALGCVIKLEVDGTPLNITAYDRRSKCNSQSGVLVPLALDAQGSKVSLTMEVRNKRFGLSVGAHYPIHWILWRGGFVLLLLTLGMAVASDGGLYRNRWVAMGGLMVVSCVMRLPFFFESYADPYHISNTLWDEATYLNMGQYMLSGHLPYVGLFDDKPPLLYLVLAAFSVLAGHELAWVRFIGALWIAGTGYLAYCIMRRMVSVSAGWYAGILYVVFVSSGLTTGSVLTDHIATLPLAGALYLALTVHKGRWRVGACGLLAGMGAIIMTNYGLMVGAMAVIVALHMPGAGLRERAMAAGRVVLCGMVPALLVFLVYIAFGQGGGAASFGGVCGHGAGRDCG